MESVDHVVVDVEKKKRKKGVRNREMYKSEVIKKSRISGVEYTNYSGKLIPPRTTGNSCRCKKQCFSKLSDSEKWFLLDKLKGLNTKNEQDVFLQSFIEGRQIERIRRKEEPGSSSAKPQAYSFKYFVQPNGKPRIEVCKTAFLSIFAVTDKQIRRLRGLLMHGKAPVDMRGVGNKNRSLPDNDRKLIHDHIASFPIKCSHYSSREYHYLDSRLNVKLMFDMFKEKHSTTKIGYKYYLNYFNSNFDLTFGQPQVDTCVTCEQLLVKIRSPTLNEKAKKVASAELMIHKRRAKKYFTSMQQSKEKSQKNENVLSLCFDFMQNLPLPRIPVQDVFYLRQLWVNVFNIHNLGTGKSIMYVYHEGIAKKGANDVCSFILDYIKNHVSDNVTELHLYSDGCVGQNRNHSLIRVCAGLVETGRFETISHFFPLRGHSFNACDRDFGLIKRFIRKQDRIYSTNEYISIILSTAKNNRFLVSKVESDHVVDVVHWWPNFYKKTAVATETINKPRNERILFQPTFFNEFQYSARTPGKVFASKYIGGLENYTFDLKKPGRDSLIQLPTSKAYTDKVPINSKKIADLKKLMRYIPEEHRDFYEEVLHWPKRVDANDE